MNNAPLKMIVIVAALVAAGFSAFYALRRTSVCAGDGKYMASQSDCQAWGVDAAVCKEVIARARQVAARAAPKTDALLPCEMRYSECFQTESGEFAPRPSFCLRMTDKAAEPAEIRYLEYESDRMNRRKTKEVRID